MGCYINTEQKQCVDNWRRGANAWIGECVVKYSMINLDPGYGDLALLLKPLKYLL